MKKITRIAALLAAGALLFGAVGCSGDDDGDEKDGVKVTASVEPAIELEEGGNDTYVVTCTVTGDTFSTNAKSLEADEPIPADYLELTASDSKVTISEVKVSEKFTDTEGKVSIKVTAAAGAKSGTITAKLLKGALTDTTDTVTATPISYTIKGDEGQQGGGDALKKSGTFEEDITQLPFSVTNGLTDTLNGDTEKNGKYTIKDGTALADGYFKIVQSEKSSTTYYTDKDRTKINSIELDKQSNNTYIEFTVTGSAVVTVSAKSTGSSNTSYVEIVKADTEGAFDTATAVSGTSNATKIEKTCPAGTYRIVVVTDDSKKSLARIESIKAVQTVN